MDNIRERGKRERNPITGDGMVNRDSQGTIHHFKSQDRLSCGSQDIEEATETDIMSEEEKQSLTSLRSGESNKDKGEIGSMMGAMTLDDKVNSVPKIRSEEKLAGEADFLQFRPLRQRQRDRNPITGDGMQDRDYRTTVPSFKIHGPQRKESNPLNFEGYVDNDKAYQSDVQDACISPLTRNEEKNAIEERPKTSFTAINKPVSRQRQRDRNPITGDGMEERDFRVQIPTFKIHGPQRQSGDPLTGNGYSKDDKDYLKQVQDACDSPLSLPENGEKASFDTSQ